MSDNYEDEGFTEPLDAGDEDAHAPAELTELHEVLSWEKAVEEESHDDPTA